MRIISGIHKGRKVKFPNSKFVRPTTDKVKETLFNILQNDISFDGIIACDIFAGSGSLGLEVLSRGAAEIHFVEKNYQVSKVLNENIISLDAEESCQIFRMDAVKFSKMSEHAVYDLILADPPFFRNCIHIVVENLINNNYISESGVLIVERSIQTEAEDEAAFGRKAFKRIGDSLIYQFKNE